MATVETTTVTLTVNGREVTVEKGRSLVEAARERSGLGVSIPIVNRDDHAGPGPLLQPAGGEPTAAAV